MSARVFIHPRCWDGPASAALAATLEERGLDMSVIKIGPENARGHRELVRCVGEPGDALMLERMDGTRFLHKPGHPAPAPEAA